MPNGRRAILDEAQRREIIAVVAVTGSRGRAAEYVGCTVGAIDAAARRDSDFGQRLQKAEVQQVIANLNNINAAGKDVRYWRAAAWALEHQYPQDFAARRPRSMSAEQIRRALTEFADVILDDIVDETLRAQIIDRLDKLAHQLATDPDGEEPDEPGQSSDERT